MNKTIKTIMILAVIIILGLITLIYTTHKSVNQELSQQDIKLKEILKDSKNNEIKIEDENLNLSNQLIQTGEEKNEIQEDIIEEVKILKTGEFDPNAKGSDSIHRGWGNVNLVEFEDTKKIVFQEDFKVTNGPDYKLYILKEQSIQTEEEFLELKNSAKQISEVKQFRGFQTFEIPQEIQEEEIGSIVIWCESFSEFISYANLN